MELKELTKLEKIKHLDEFKVKQLITEVSLYQKILITTNDVAYNQGTEGRSPSKICVSKDVKALHDFYDYNKRLELPCAECKKDYPFNILEAWNPRMYNQSKDKKCYQPNLLTVNVPQQVPEYISRNSWEGIPDFNTNYCFGKDLIAYADKKNFENCEWEQVKWKCGNVCMRGILKNVAEFRKDYSCTYDQGHKGFVDFIIIPALQDESICSENVDCDENFWKLYQKYSNSLIMIKVGQYPSLMDMQLFDTRKYEKILKHDYTYYTRALGLNADGIGIGSFVYLRRILEDIVEAIHQECKDANFEEKAYEEKSFNEQIEFLEKNYNKAIIPEELGDIRNKIYGVFSKGVHEYTEQECLELFPAAKYIIDKFLDERICSQAKEEELSEVKRQFQNG